MGIRQAYDTLFSFFFSISRFHSFMCDACVMIYS
jgi:hypothetical protein